MKRLWLLALVCAVAACDGTFADETVTTTTAAVETTLVATTSSLQPATTSMPESTDICGGGPATLWQPGRTYLAGCFLVPVSFAPDDAGWRTSDVDDDRFHVTLVQGGEPVAEVALLAYQPTHDRNTIADSIVELEGLSVVADPSEVTVAGLPAVVLDVESALGQERSAGFSDRCHSVSLGTVIAFDGGPGWPLLRGGLDGQFDYGFSPCRTFRVWVVEAADESITMIATANDEATLSEWMPAIERLVDSITFEVP